MPDAQPRFVIGPGRGLDARSRGCPCRRECDRMVCASRKLRIIDAVSDALIMPCSRSPSSWATNSSGSCHIDLHQRIPGGKAGALTSARCAGVVRLEWDHNDMRFCRGDEYQQVGGGALGTSADVNLVRIHAVRMPPVGSDPRAVCGQPVGRVHVTTDWQGLMAWTGPERCARCEAVTGSTR